VTTSRAEKFIAKKVGKQRKSAASSIAYDALSRQKFTGICKLDAPGRIFRGLVAMKDDAMPMAQE
jgi:hypothetical protein